ncbi:hypothetical protein CYG49_04125 [Candidatus Saccharibacteria bacterium]|nr:MAG: hypothetical protein CYG49_04125 [Candidatus Saccharibacteria bacterium]
MEKEQTDIFLWANSIEGMRDSIDIELFLFNKNYTLYSVNYSQEILKQMKELFLFELLNFVAAGPSEGLVVRDMEEVAAEELVLLRTDLSNVENAQTILNKLASEEEEIEAFTEQDHEFKRVKGIMARFTHGSLKRPFYVFKVVSQAQVLKGSTSWMFEGDRFKPFTADAGLRVAPDNQVLIIGDDIFAFNQSKFEKLFNYQARQQTIARQKVAEIEANFKLSFAEGVTLQSMVREKKKTITKLQKINPSLVTQEQLIDHADEMGQELMVDDDGAIIIMDGKDLDVFVNLLNDDYIQSQMTGITYEIRGKKPLTPIDSTDAALPAEAPKLL